MNKETLRRILSILTLFYSIVFLYHLAACAEPPYPDAAGPIQSEVPIETPAHLTEQIDNQYKRNCYRQEYWYCTPEIDPSPEPLPSNTSIYRSIHIVDICIDETVSVGECLEVFECDPTQFKLKEVDCFDEENRPGTKSVYCDKGFLRETKCQSYCIEETCDGTDDDCDGETDEGQLNPCGECGQVGKEFCDNIDNDCNGIVDDELVRACSTECGTGFEFCFSGEWQGCTAKQKQKEVCDGIDNDCDGFTDEDIKCGCEVDQVGALIPCAGPPLKCGVGYQMCKCEDEDCENIYLVGCYPLCYFFPDQFEGECDITLGEPKNEKCNNWDDNCNTLIDEDLHKQCYSGPDGTQGVGICQSGEQYCKNGQWGNNQDGSFVAELCEGEITPLASDSCNGIDDDCDGIIDSGKEMQDTDIVFIVDWSGSMDEEIAATIEAMTSFAFYYGNEQTVRWSLMTAPYGYLYLSNLTLQVNLADFDVFYSKLSSLEVSSNSGGHEMLLDAIYLTLHDIASEESITYSKNDLAWYGVSSSVPPIWEWLISWRPDARKVIIVFSDEAPQSFMKPKVKDADVKKLIGGVEKLNVYTFSTEVVKKYWSNSSWHGWQPIAAASEKGKWFKLTDDPESMYNDLMQIIDENVCGED